MSTDTPHTHRRPPAAAILIVPLVVAILLTLFAWPNARLEPRELPVGVAGPPTAAQHLDRAQGGAFDVHRYADETAARTAIEDREVYGAFVAAPGGGKVLIASAASQMVAQQLTHAASQDGAPVQVEDVVPATREGFALPSSVLPLVIAGIITGLAAAAMGSTALRRTALVIAGSVLAGLGATAIIQGWLDVVGGDWLANAAALSLTVMAIAALVAGFEALLGKAGVALAALTMVFIGNPFSGAASGHELLPQPVGDLGQLLPPGAGASLLRSTGFFDGAAVGSHVAVLAAWALLGFTALAISALRARPVPARAAVQGAG
jgi:hypothetical protein